MKRIYAAAIATALTVGMLAGCDDDINNGALIVDVTPTLPSVTTPGGAETTTLAEIETEPAVTTTAPPPETTPKPVTTTKKPVVTTKKPPVTTKKPETTTRPVTTPPVTTVVTTTPVTTTPITTTPGLATGGATMYSRPETTTTPDPWGNNNWWETTTTPDPWGAVTTTTPDPWYNTTPPGRTTPPMSQPSIGWETDVDYNANDKRAEEVFKAVSQWSMERSIYFTWEEKKDLPKYYWGNRDLMQYNTWAFDLEKFFPNKMDGYWYVKMKDSDPVLVDYVIWCGKDFSDTNEWNAYSDVNKGYYKG